MTKLEVVSRALICAAAAIGCSGTSGSTAASGGELGIGGTTGNTGGAPGGTQSSGGTAAPSSTGGRSTIGGANSVGGTGAFGGVVSTGGNPATGGIANVGGSTGGTPATGGTRAVGGTTGASVSGGAPATGGSNALGGATSSGGLSATGGSHSSGGTNAIGGSATGGSEATGGAAATGGSKATGGAVATGGSKATGGAAATGGTTSGNLPPGVTGLFPPPGGQGICADPILRLTFSGAPTLGSSGTISVFNASGTAVATIDMSVSQTTDTIGGLSFTILRPVYVDGNTVSIRLPSNGLSYGQTYYVNISGSALSGPSGSLTITGNTAWRFTTVASAPSNLTAISVATDNSGQFCTVQGALNAIAANNTTARTITVNAGIYHEIVYFTRKSNITIQGTDQNGTVIAATNNNNVNASTQGRALFGVDNVTGLQIKNLTIYNQTPQGGSQAEALRLQSCDQCVVRNATIQSLQDTLLWSGRVYADSCLIEGNVDYVWGTGVAYFNKCEIRTIGRSGVIVQSRNGAGAYGYVFVDSKLTADSVATNNMLARIDVSAYPDSHVAYVNCQMTNIAPAGWTITGGTALSTLRFWEYQSTDAAGNALNVSQRVAGSTQISASQAAQMRDPTVVLGGWQPPAN